MVTTYFLTIHYVSGTRANKNPCPYGVGDRYQSRLRIMLMEDIEEKK